MIREIYSKLWPNRSGSLGLVLCLGLLCYGGLAQAATLNVPGGYGSIQAAINAAGSGDTVLVADGTYVENINFNGKAITVRSENGAATTTINGNASGSVVTFSSGEGADSVLDGFKLTNGDGTVYGSYSYGGGIFCYSSSPVITNCTISGNTVTGIYGNGGGIYCDSSSSPVITNCTISGNTAADGGGIYCFGSSSSPVITNCTISGNTASNDGGGIDCMYSSPTIINCTISGNTANTWGGGIYCYASSLTVVNSILWGDTAGSSGNEITGHLSSFNVTHSDIEGGQAGTGNIDVDPLFVGGGDYHLQSGSPCIDVGTSSGAPSDDIDGDARPYDVPSIPNNPSAYDMGSDEYVGGVAAPSNLTATVVSNSQIDLTWSDNSSDEEFFSIERKTGAGAYAEIATVGADTTSYSDTGLSGGTEYCYRVLAVKNGEYAGYSNEGCATTCTTPTCTVAELMDQGRQAIQDMWQNEDIRYLQTANDKFAAALALAPNSQGANFHYALTRLAVLMLDADLHALLDQAGMAAGDYAPGEPRDPFNWTADFQRDANDRVVLPPGAPTGQDIVNWRDTTLLPEIDGAIANLGMLGTGYSHTFPPEATQADQELEVDYGDFQIIKANLEIFKTFMQTLAGYDCIVALGSMADLVDNVNNGVITNINTFLDTYPNVLKVNAPSRLTSAKASLRAAITSYNNGSDFIRNQDDGNQDDDLIVLEAEDLADEAEFRDILTKINTALDGPQQFCIHKNDLGTCLEYLTLDLSQFFDDPIDLRNYLPTLTDDDAAVYGSFPDPTFSGIFPDFDQEKIARYFPLSDYYVNVNTGSDDNSGGIAAYPLKTITEALDRAEGTTIHVAAGTYNLASGEEFPLDIWQDGLLLQGASASNTIIDASGSGQGVIQMSGGAIDGFTITGGSGWQGGIGCWGDATISNNIITGNSSNSGAGISISGSPVITDNTIVSNTSQWSGGGIIMWSGSPTISNNIIRNNVSLGEYGAYGGGIYCGWGSSAIITNNIISGNKAMGSYSRGGGVYCYYSSPQITNCTISDNFSTLPGGGMSFHYGSSATVLNSILWGNNAGDNNNEIYLDETVTDYEGNVLACSVSVTYSNINPSYITGPGTSSLSDNINSDPLFVGGGDYHLTASSPCIDVGTGTGAPAEDIDGDARPQGDGYDMGADEYLDVSACNNISLTNGWNLMSLPSQPTNTVIGSVLSSISGKYASVWAFMNNAWKVYDPASPGFSDLSNMEAGWGYWIKMTEAASFSISGSTPSNSIDLVSGWNLVGYNSTDSQAIADALASIDTKYVSVWAFIGTWKVYDPASPGFSDLLTMGPNYGYWINTTQACTWTLTVP